jgi:hypothetical protein
MVELKQPYENIWPGAWAVGPCCAEKGGLGMNGGSEAAVHNHIVEVGKVGSSMLEGPAATAVKRTTSAAVEGPAAQLLL